ncbi:type II secretion system protein [Herbaspirillum sp. C9C3]|uniref:type II secretion system protein n=1 Tax=Herbaspirillum sp. C9C3 TaxID=2735271 RepID=UPI0015852700|nr:type II secretion system protein [Herbaspirillum sp. C9C3]NUT60851.1 type II secretion system protein [Herbaspirillum sp. C9C3]
MIIALSGMVLAGAGVVWSTTLQREKEEELLAIGQEVRAAIAQYYLRTPGTIKRYPPNLDALLLDSRQAAVTRHLRKIYRDPITGKANWGLISSPDGGVMGIYSLSDRAPIRRSFDGAELDLNRRKKYSDWHFQYVPNVPAFIEK